MNLENYKATWEQLKVNNSLLPLASGELLLSIDQLEIQQQPKWRRVLINAVFFLIMIFFIQGG